MKKYFIGLLIVVLVLVVGAFLARNIIATHLIKKTVRDMLGLDMNIGSIDLGVFSTTVKITDLDIVNPAGFTKEYMAEVPEIYVDYALRDIVKGFIHLPEVRINVARVSVEKNKAGNLNIDKIQPVAAPEKKETKEPAKNTEMLINKMNLKIGAITYIDNSKTPPGKKEYKFNYDKTFTNIKDTSVIVDSIVSAVMGQLIAEGINVTLDKFLGDKDFMGSLMKGDSKEMKKAGKKDLQDLGEGLEQKIFGGSGSEKKTPAAAARPAKKDQGSGVESLFGDFLSGGKNQ